MAKRKDYITLLSVISALAVVFLHVNGCFWTFSKDRYWFTANIIESVFYFAVPIFFMITGANLIDYQKKYSTKEFFKKRLLKTFLPFVIWSIIGLLYLIIKKQVLIQNISFKYIFDGLFSSPYIGIYWFFINLFCVYLCIPLFSAVDDSKKKSVFTYLVVAGFVLNSLIPFVISVFKLNLNFSISIYVSSNYLLFVLIGYLLDNYDIKKSWKYIIYFLGILGLLMHIIGTYILSIDANTIIHTYKGYNNVPCIMYSVSVFLLIKDVSKYIKNYKYINLYGKYTFAIYSMHWYIMDILVYVLNINTISIAYRLCFPFIIVAICIGITYIIRKIPFLKHIVP